MRWVRINSVLQTYVEWSRRESMGKDRDSDGTMLGRKERFGC